MALNETLTLNITEAQRQISVLESQLDQLARPITVPVNVQGGGELDSIRRDLDSSEGAVAELNRELGETDDQLRTVAGDAKRAGDDIERTGRRGATAFDGLGRSLLGFTAALGGIALVRGAFDFAGDAITAASSLEQSVGALDAVFGELGTTVAEFGETADQSVGLAASQFNQLAAVLGSQLQTFGFNVQDAATETQNLITLASDLAATFGGPVSQAVEAISSLLRGEVNPIERYGVAMNEAAIQSRALEDGLAATASELTFQDKTMARLAILYEQTANAQGQFGREADTTAGQLERLSAQAENARAAIGEALTPALQVILDIAPSVVSAIETSLVPALAGLAGAAEDFDSQAVVGFLAGLPQAAITAGSQLAEAGSAFGAFGAAVEDLFGLRFGELTSDFENFIDAVGDFGSIGVANQTIQTFIDTLATGTDPLLAFGLTLEQLGQDVATMDLEDFETLAEQLLAIGEAAGLDPGELRQLAENVVAFGEEAGFSAAGIEILANVLLGPWAQAQAEASSGDIIFQNLAAAMAQTGDAAEGAAPLISGFGEAVGQVSQGDAAFDRLVNGIEEELGRLPGIFDVANRALEDAKGDVITTAEGFLEDLRKEFEAQTLFEDNIEAARALGFDNLVAAAEQFGPEFAPILADALANPATAALIDSQFDIFATERAANARQALETALFDEFASAPFNVTVDLDVALGNINLPGAGNLFENINIPGPGGGGVPAAPPTGGTGGGTVTVLEFNGFVPSTPDIARASQAVSSINTVS